MHGSMHLNNEHFILTKDVFPRKTMNVLQITFLNVEKLNLIGFIRVSLIALDLKYKLCSIIAKPRICLQFALFTPI